MSDPRVQEEIAKADKKLFSVYGDTTHHNDGIHLEGGIGIAEDQKMQRLWLWIVKDPHPLYDIPWGKIGNRFLKIQSSTRERVSAIGT